MKKILISVILILTFLLLQRYRSLGQNNVLTTPTNIASSTEENFFIDDFELWSSTPSTGILSTIQFSWPVVHQENGLILYKEPEQVSNYLFVIDPTQKNISVKNLYGHMDEHWNQATNPVCVINGGFFEGDGSPSLPLVENGITIPGQVTTKFPTRILYINYGLLTVADITTNDEVQSSQWAISGLQPTYYSDDNVVTNRTVVGIKDNLLYVMITRNRTIDDLVNLLTEQLLIDHSTIIALDSGYSTQVRCFGEDLLYSKSIMGSTLVISNP